MSKKCVRLDRKKGLYLKDTEVKGRGLFCVDDIKAGETLEVTPALILNEAATIHIDKTMLENYTFVTGKVSKRIRDRKRIKKTGDCSSLVMGIASFCNQDDAPNAEVLWEEKNGTLYNILSATRRIPRNTEICTSYGKGWFDDRD